MIDVINAAKLKITVAVGNMLTALTRDAPADIPRLAFSRVTFRRAFSRGISRCATIIHLRALFAAIAAWRRRLTLNNRHQMSTTTRSRL